MIKKTLLAIGTFLLGAQLSFAHCGKCGKGEADKYSEDAITQKVEKLEKKLKLSAKQKEKVEEIIRTKFTEMKAIQDKKKEVKEKYQADMKGVLSEKQMKKYEKMKEKRKKDHKHGHKCTKDCGAECPYKSKSKKGKK